MQWFKHLTKSRHDPFIFDLRQKFGGDGYFVYFGGLEIYAENFKPDAGWFLDVSFSFLKHELGVYHGKKLRTILDFIRSWPDVDGAGNRAIQPTLPEDPGKIPGRSGEDNGQSLDNLSDICPKWVVNLSGDRVSLLIPNFLKILDDYTRRKLRNSDGMSEHSPNNVRQEPEQKQKRKKNPPDGGVDGGVAAIFRDVSRDVEVLETFAPIRGRIFPGRGFVNKCLKADLHPAAIRDGTTGLIKQWTKASEQPDFDPFGYGFAIAKSRNQYYQDDPVDMTLIKTVFGGFFNGR
jgi:hypothetical protein